MSRHPIYRLMGPTFGGFDMNDAHRADLNQDIIVEAFDVMGRYLRDQCGLVGEIAVYGGTAMLLQFPWRTITEDVDVTILTGERESAVKDAAAFAGLRLGLPDDWLNNYVGGFTPETESQAFFSIHGVYPRGEAPGLRVFLAKPEYLCAMKLKALERENLDDRDFEDAVNLALEIGIDTVDHLKQLFTSFFPGETLHSSAAARLPELAEKIQVRRRR
jgi:hypothetical protein